MTDRHRRVVAGVIAFGALIAFVAVHGVASVIALSTSPGNQLPQSITSDQFAYVANALTGLVGSIVAAAYGLPAGADERGATQARSARLEHLTGLRAPGTPRRRDWRSGLVKTYVLGYAAICILSVCAWLFAPVGVVASTESLALVGIGVLMAIANGALIPANRPTDAPR